MKKFYLGALSCLLAIGAGAQTFDPMTSVNASIIGSIGKEFTNSGKSIAYFLEGYQEGCLSFKLYNEGFEEIRSLSLYTGTDEGFAIPLINMDISAVSDKTSESIVFTQALFNNDDKFEYVKFVYDDNDKYRIKTFEIVNENNEVLTVINSPADSKRSYPRILKWNGNYYFAIYSYTTDYIYFWDIYLIEKSTNDVRKVNAAPLMSVMPALVERNSTINVVLNAETAKNGGELIITDSNGRIVGRNYVEAGQTSVPVTTERMSSGVYNITLSEKGLKVENTRIIVK